MRGYNEPGEDVRAVARIHGITAPTEILRQARYAAALTTIVEATSPMALSIVLHPDSSISAAELEELANAKPTIIRNELRRLREAQPDLVDAPLFP